MVPGCSCSQEQLSKNNLQSEISTNICKQGWKQEQNPKQGSEGQVPKQGSQAKLRKPGSRARSQWTGLKQTGKVSKNRFPRESSQEQVTRQCSQERVPKNRLPRTGSQARFRSVKQRVQEQLPRQGSKNIEQQNQENCKVWRLVLITEWRDWRRTSFASKHDTALAHG